MAGRVGQCMAVMLAVNAYKAAANIPHHGSGNRHPIQPTAAFSFRRDFAIEQQAVFRFVPGLFQLALYLFRDLLKGGPDARFARASPNQIPGDPAAHDCLDGVDQNGLARAGLTGQHIEALIKVDLCFFDHGYIFNLQFGKHGSTLFSTLASQCSIT